jgi:hypothetical protein
MMRTFVRFLPVFLVLLLLLAAGLVVYSQRAYDPRAGIPADPFLSEPDQRLTPELSARAEVANYYGHPIPHKGIANVGLPVGRMGPEIEGKDYYGKWFKLSDYRGKVVVLDCWVDY